MLRGYARIAIRNILREKFYSFLNVLGLAIGIACFILISLWIADELSFDRHFRNYQRIHRIESSLVTEGIPKPMVATDRRLLPKLREQYRHVCTPVSVYKTPTLLSYAQRSIYEEQAFYADETFFEVFSFHFIHGDPATALSEEGTVVITETVSKKIFGNRNPVGDTIRINNHQTKEKSKAYVVTGVVTDNKKNSHFHPSVIFRKKGNMDTFEIVYILLHQGYTASYFVDSVWKPLYYKYFRPNYINDRQDITLDRVQPLAEIHLGGTRWEDFETNGDRFLIYIFAAIGLLILSLSCINYINLSTARSFSRSREIGVRKVLGAGRRQIIAQFLIESILTTVIALLLALSFVEMSIPAFNSLSDKDIVFHVLDPSVLIYSVLLAIAVGFLSGIYPAFFISSFQPVKALRGVLDMPANKPTIRKSLVVLQFSISIIMLIATVIVSQQLRFLKRQNLGFDTDRMLLVSLNDELANKQQAEMKDALLKNKNVVRASMSHNIPGGEVNNTYISFEMPDGMHARLINSMFVDHDFLKVMRLKLLEGSDFDSSMKNKLDTNAFIIINESAKKLLGYEQAVGKKVNTGYHYGFRQGEIIGVVKDFHVASLHRPIEPLVLALGTLGRPEGKKKFLTIKVRAADLPNTIDFIRRTYARFGQGYPFQYNFLDQEFNDQYRKEEKQKILFTCFAILSILCSFLGLVGLVSFVVKHRAKEIAIRRILGASTADIVATLSRDFLRLMLLAWIVAAPVAYLVMHSWLQMFAYHVSLQFSVFGLAGLATLLLVAATVALQIVIAARKSPAAVLRHD